MSTENCESLASVEDEDKIKDLLMAFQEPERSAVKDLPAASNVEDLTLMVKLYQAGKPFKRNIQRFISFVIAKEFWFFFWKKNFILKKKFLFWKKIFLLKKNCFCWKKIFFSQLIYVSEFSLDTLGYFKGEHHLEEIMYFENLRRSQLLQLLDKFRDVLIIYETEDPAIATLYTQT